MAATKAFFRCVLWDTAGLSLKTCWSWMDTASLCHHKPVLAFFPPPWGSFWILTKMLAKARQIYFWTGLKADLAVVSASCTVCSELSPNQTKEPLIHSSSSFPMEMVGVDLFQALWKDFLVMVNKFSGFPFLKMLPSLDNAAVVSLLEE